MSGLCVYGFFHFITLITLTYKEYKKDGDIYDLFIRSVTNKGLYFCHSTFLLFIIYLMAKFLTRSFLGALHSEEVSVLNENCIYYLADIILVVSLFSENISAQNFLIFCTLISLKCLLWIFEQRALSQKDLKVILYGCHISFLSFAFLCFSFFSAILKPSIHILFAFEFAVILLASLKTLLKIYFEEVYSDNQKIHFHFYLDISFILVKLKITLILFVWTSVTLRIPFNTLRDIFKIFSQLNSTIKNYNGVKKVYDNLEKCDSVHEGICPICREEMGEGKKILCGHSFHTNCLKKWAEKQQMCPICRQQMFSEKNIIKLQSNEETITGLSVDLIN